MWTIKFSYRIAQIQMLFGMYERWAQSKSLRMKYYWPPENSTKQLQSIVSRFWSNQLVIYMVCLTQVCHNRIRLQYIRAFDPLSTANQPNNYDDVIDTAFQLWIFEFVLCDNDSSRPTLNEHFIHLTSCFLCCLI